MRSNRIEEARPNNPRNDANWLSALTFWYTLKIFRMGKRNDFTEDDLTKPLPSHKSSILGEKIARMWSAEVDRKRAVNKMPNLLKVLFQCFLKEFVVYGIVLFIMEVMLRVSQPVLIGLLIRYFDPRNKSNQNLADSPRYLKRVFNYETKSQPPITFTEAVIYGICIFVTSLLVTSTLHPVMMGVIHLGMKVRVACCSLIYRKVLRLKIESLGGKTVGTAITLISNDVNRFDWAPHYLHYLWISPLQCLVIVYFMYQEIQVAAFIGIMGIVLFIPLQGSLGVAMSKLRYRTGERTDERVRQMNEIIRGIQVIKMYAWENAFIEKINILRQKELSVLKYMSYLRGLVMSFIMFAARFGVFLSIVSYILLGNEINVEKIFVITGYYQILRTTMTVFLPQGIALAAEALVSVKRIRFFLLTPESDVGDHLPLDPDWFHKSDKIVRNELDIIAKKIGIPLGVVVENASAKYGEVLCLKNISFVALPGEITAIIGQVGSGKSCLLNLILGELVAIDGIVDCYGKLSYASQEPWLFAASVRENILFGQPYNRNRYKQVVQVCALARDFNLFPFGDKTIVGERGVSLSGGQRARINLARAIYREADVYLLDDPLSAVDTQVGQHLFEECISKYLSHKVVLLVTHQLQFLKQVHQIIILDGGAVVIKGTYSDLREHGVNVTNFDDVMESEDTDPIFTVQSILNKISIHSNIALVDSIDVLKPKEVEEMRTIGRVKTDIYLQYFRAGGNYFIILAMFLLFIGAQALASFTDYFLAYWMKLYQHYDENPKRFNRYISVTEFTQMYSLLMLGLAFVSVVRSLFFFTVAVRASLTLHQKMFIAIIKATIKFFNVNPSGRILNRFSKDLGAIDEFLPNTMIDTFQIFFNIIGLVFVVSAISYYFVVPTVAACGICYFLRSYYIKTGRSVKRVEAITRSPIFSHLNATLQGLSTIRCHQKEMLLTNEFDKYQDVHSSSWFLFISTSRAFGYWLDLVCVFYIGMILCILFYLQHQMYGSDVGLCLTQCIGLTGLFQWGMRQSAELENHMTSVERVLEFTRIEQEPPLESVRHPNQNLPSLGHQKAKLFSKNHNKAQEKVGIVGRTGAGKSSLISALFRLAYVEGELIIDNIDVTKIGLHDLRRKISIIPQEPILFSGTLRYNLDPFDEYPDSALVMSLQTVEIGSALTEGQQYLDTIITEGGGNISVGHRQLICLSRAILRNNKILVLDEATANVDVNTDQFIQSTIRTKFAQCTVLTIAHRLHTIMDSDKVIVIDAGTVVEFGHPYILFQNKRGHFSAMVRNTGTLMEQQLKTIALHDYQKKSELETETDSESEESDTSLNLLTSSEVARKQFKRKQKRPGRDDSDSND
ncbi:hypothetical protein FQR65_LT10282 [Abscondita terminalis]|nr:hypothetical protein FQR65_LT10282 [Abscondita terminalis]